VLFKADGTVVARLGKFLGNQTNNHAEYMGLILGLESALKLGAEEIEVRADSELMVRQLLGTYRVKNAGLKPLFTRAQALLARFGKVDIAHVPREKNRDADEMSNRAIDERM
jgi:ribonuclease HI